MNSKADYVALAEQHWGLPVQGEANPYTSLNGNMFSFLSKEGDICLRMSQQDQSAFWAEHGGEPVVQYGSVMNGYVTLPQSFTLLTRPCVWTKQHRLLPYSASGGKIMSNKGWLGVGLAGTVFAALCCFTPFLPFLLGALGLGSLLGLVYNDLVLLPLLAGFMILTGVTLWRLNKNRSN